MTTYTQIEIDHGKARMKKHLKQMIAKQQAELEAGTNNIEAVATSAVGRNSLANLRFAHFHALIVYNRGPGVWYADIMFKGQPPGVPEIIGTPVASPLKTREQAEEDGLLMLESVVSNILANKSARSASAPEGLAVFQFNEKMSLTLPQEVLANYARVHHDDVVNANLAKLEAEIIEVLRKHFGGAENVESPEQMASMPKADEFRVLENCVILMLRGVLKLGMSKPPSPTIDESTQGMSRN